MSGAQPETLKEFVLGGLAPAQREEMDERLLTDPDFHAEVQATGDDLIQAYLADELAQPDRERFESFFLASPRRRERVAFMRSLLAAADAGQSGRTQSGAAAATPGRPLPTSLLPWAAALVVGLAAGGWGLSERRLRDREAAAAQAREASLREELDAQKQQVSALAGLKDPASWTLRAGVERGRGTGETIQPRGTWIRLRVPLEGVSRQAFYRASLQTVDGTEISFVPRLTEAAGPDERMLDVMVPTAALRPGTYVLVIQSGDSGDHRELTAAPFEVR